MKPYDDPYIILANILLVDYSTVELKRIISDKEFTRKIIEKELRQIDFCGPFVDCVLADIYANNKWIFLDMLNEFSHKLYSELDLDRLEKAIRKICDDFGIELD